MTFWNYRSTIASADCFDRYYWLSDFHTIVLTLIIIIRMLGRWRPIAWSCLPGMSTSNCKVLLLADEGFGAITYLVQPNLPWTSGCSWI